MREYPSTISAYPFGDSVHVTFRDDEFDQSLFEYLSSKGINNAVINETRAGIEDRFLELMKPEKLGLGSQGAGLKVVCQNIISRRSVHITGSYRAQNTVQKLRDIGFSCFFNAFMVFMGSNIPKWLIWDSGWIAIFV